MGSWARTLPDVRVEVPCGGTTHEVRLRRGKLVLVDHVLASEAVTAALGGGTTPCFDVYRSWRAREQWEVALQPRGPGFHQLYRRPPLPAGLGSALERGIVRGRERRSGRGEAVAGYALERSLRAKAEPALADAFRAAVRHHDGGPTRRLELTIGPTPWASGDITGTNSSLLVRVEPDWLRTVGLPRLAAGPSGHDFVLAVRPARLVLGWKPRPGGGMTACIDEDPA